jgi:ABC-type polysaccharide/polyol phosphate transport system ATPase subunit
MSNAHITFDGVWKRFRRGAVHDSLRDMIPAVAKKVFGRSEPTSNGLSKKEFWALRDLSFEVKPGEVLGIIGANGAGKSTTLKILNRIMEPSAGIATAEGRIGALIEVSAGFHPDLTGRQNVFLQGAIMGMNKSDVTRKFDDIVDFSGIADFIDTPVKRYSSGMNARLGFSIAAHLEPEVLIIDEVLAVGDFAFQARAFGRIKEMALGGAPVVLVSHQLDRIAELCTKAILLEKGGVRMAGTARECINEYVHSTAVETVNARYGDVGIHFDEITMPLGAAAFSGDELSFRVRGHAEAATPAAGWTPLLRVLNGETGMVLHAIKGDDRGVALPLNGPFEWDLTLQMNLQPGWYRVETAIWDTSRETDVVSGPGARVEVLERSRFWGDAQLNSRWQLK